MKKIIAYHLQLLMVLVAAGAAGQDEVSEGNERPDLLTFGRGTVFVSQTGLASGSASGALLAINGDG